MWWYVDGSGVDSGVPLTYCTWLLCVVWGAGGMRSSSFNGLSHVNTILILSLLLIWYLRPPWITFTVQGLPGELNKKAGRMVYCWAPPSFPFPFSIFFLLSCDLGHLPWYHIKHTWPAPTGSLGVMIGHHLPLSLAWQLVTLDMAVSHAEELEQ